MANAHGDAVPCSHNGSGCLELPLEVVAQSAAKLFDCARPIGRLACASSAFQCCLAGGTRRKLKVGVMQTSCIQSLMESLSRVDLSKLVELRIDFSAGSREWRTRQDIERAVRHLSSCLGEASSLQKLSIRMAAFDNSMERLRLSADVWSGLLHGLSSLASHGKLRSLALSSFAIKEHSGRQLRRAVSSPEPETGDHEISRCVAKRSLKSPSFAEVISRGLLLEELTLTSNEIYSPTAQSLAQIFRQLAQLKIVDLSRNHISQEVMHAVREALPEKAELRGERNQTVCC